MPFFGRLKGKKNKKIVTLQVQVPINHKRKSSVRRVLSSAFDSGKGGSLTIEAAMILPLFIFFMVLMMMIMNIMDINRTAQTALEEVGEELSQYAYLLDRGEEDKGDKEMLESLSGAGALLYVRGKMELKLDTKRLESISFLKSSILQEGDMIDLVMNYRVKLPFSVFRLKSLPMTARSARRAWIGRKEDGGEETLESGQIVYIGRDSTRYHVLRTCHYLYNDVKQVTRSEAEQMKNRYGQYYKPCAQCRPLGEGDSIVYIMPAGEKFHGDNNCSSIISYVSAVPMESVRHMGACSYCSH